MPVSVILAVAYVTAPNPQCKCKEVNCEVNMIIGHASAVILQTTDNVYVVAPNGVVDRR